MGLFCGEKRHDEDIATRDRSLRRSLKPIPKDPPNQTSARHWHPKTDEQDGVAVGDQKRGLVNK